MNEAEAAWLPAGKRAAVCFTIDDIHPGRSSDAYEAGGDLGAGALGHVAWLLDRHPYLHVTLFVTPDWREREPYPTRRLLARIPGVRDRVWLTRRLPPDTMRLDRHPRFVDYIASLPRTEIGLHGLHHVHRGRRVMIEFQDEDVHTCRTTLERAIEIFAAAGLPAPSGMTPPGWNAPPALLDAMHDVGLDYVASARDIITPISAGATTAMSGLNGVPLTAPAQLSNGLVHVPANVQATSPVDRVEEIVRAGGLVSIKGHIVKSAFGHIALDGIDELYRNYLDVLFRHLHETHGDDLWWASMRDIANRAARDEHLATSPT